MAAEAIIPTSAEEAARAFGDGAGITVVGGGTILLPEIAEGKLRPARALLLHRSGLDAVGRSDGVVRVGAMVTLAELAGGEDALLRRVAEHIADGEVRRNATVGGNLCAGPGGRGGQRGDLGAPLIALGARVRSTGNGGERVEPVEDFLADGLAGRLVLAVEYDDVPRKWAAEGMRRRHAHSFAVATVAACSASDGLRIGVSGASPTAVRCRTVEQSRNPDDVLKDVDPVDDAVASAAYRGKMLRVLVQRALDTLARES